MADEKKDDKKPLPLPPMLGGLKFPPLTGFGPSGPAKASLPPLPGLSAAVAPAPMPLAPPQAPRPPEPPGNELERKLAETEKRLQEEREKVLLANLRSQEERVYAAKVETAIKDVQDKLRRDRRDADVEETRIKLENRIQELEQRLVQERETWVTTLKGQMQTRQTEDREIETHFTSKHQEMERRWLEEKALWQRGVLAKEEEFRKEKKFMEGRIAELGQELASAQGQAKAMGDHEREYFAMKADLTLAREQAKMQQQMLEQQIAKLRSDHEPELQKAKAQAEAANATLMRLRAVGAALERQVASLRAQFEETSKAKRELEQMNERYKAEFLVLQRRWIDREKELRSETEAAVEKTRREAEIALAQARRDAEEERRRASLLEGERQHQRVSGLIRPEPPTA